MTEEVVRSTLINIMIGAAEEAAEIILSKSLSDIHAEEKYLGSFVTKADTEAEAKLKEVLQEAYPGYGFLMEESGKTPGENETTKWIVDPLDGTTNYSRGHDTWAVSIALEVNGEIVACVTYAPRKQVLFWAEKGAGAWMQDRFRAEPPFVDQRLAVSKLDKIDRALMVVYPQQEFIDGPKTLLERNGSDIRIVGSGCLELAYTAAGRFDAMVMRGKFGPWDLAAGSLLVREAGGVITALDGNSQFIYGKTVLAANPDLHATILENMRSCQGRIVPNAPRRKLCLKWLRP
jgi:myo-inositol-1(or 4)-monophosphatase